MSPLHSVFSKLRRTSTPARVTYCFISARGVTIKSCFSLDRRRSPYVSPPLLRCNSKCRNESPYAPPVGPLREWIVRLSCRRSNRASHNRPCDRWQSDQVDNGRRSRRGDRNGRWRESGWKERRRRIRAARLSSATGPTRQIGLNPWRVAPKIAPCSKPSGFSPRQLLRRSFPLCVATHPFGHVT